MPRFVAFLRAINVGGRNIKMEALRAHFSSPSFSQVETYIASGNVIFEARSTSTLLEKKIEALLLEALGYEVTTFIRTDAEVANIARHQPFDQHSMQKAQAINIALLKAPLTDESREIAKNFNTDIDAFHVHGREVYWLCRKKQSESRFSNALFERKLGVSATFRSLSTMLKLAATYPPP